MARPSPTTIQSTLEAWDADVTNNFNLVFAGPLPLVVYANFAAIPAANQFDQCLVSFNDATAGWIMALSNGTTFRKVGVQAAAEADSTATTVANLKNDFNSLLAKLRTAGLLAP